LECRCVETKATEQTGLVNGMKEKGTNATGGETGINGRSKTGVRAWIWAGGLDADE